ncbi:MAG: transposase [Chloroflexi bacterium]|nr:transposase [Chloroflexota bacterium]
MSDNRRVYRRIESKLRQLFPQRLTGNQARHMNTLAAMITGIVQSKSCNLGAMAGKIPTKNQVASVEKKFTRFIKNDNVSYDLFFLPFIIVILQQLSQSGPLLLAMDASVTGRKCMTLMVSLIYNNRAIPIAWVTVTGSKGHLSEDIHLELLDKVKPLIPTGANVIFLGDGEFDGNRLQAAINNEENWEYVCRTAKNRLVCSDGDSFALDEILLLPGDCIDIPKAAVTADKYGPVLVIAWWEEGYKEPIYLVTNMECTQEACHWYSYRFTIETFFSDQKSRGFNLQKSHLSSPERIARLLIASCIAYIWIIYLGVLAVKNKVLPEIHRRGRCDLSLFQLGLRYLERILNQELEIPFELILPKLKSVR